MLKELEGYDWEEVFGEGRGSNCTAIKPNRRPGDTRTSNATFSREDVTEIKGISEGESDVRSWIVWGRLKDRRYFIARGHCDYTGWDCRAENSGDVASTQKELIQFGMEPEERERFGVHAALAEKTQP